MMDQVLIYIVSIWIVKVNTIDSPLVINMDI